MTRDHSFATFSISTLRLRRTRDDNGEEISALPAWTAFVKAANIDWSEWLLTELVVL